ncbi:hypothetical protein LPMP_341010 [Leishmania panamensis]|uniref:Uncharacterized protein n=1 Tax=Leishmania panamensis TaxID=5679 RepID=A0A088S0L4_LEIPA|nr:hypothetical protein LPMP_341010 [Leishmania panamensis]AIO01726.1 hypothetical protein LPMP_341010 [Leishmania panamensis]
MPPPRSVSMKRRAVGAEPHYESATFSPQETESMALTSATTTTTMSGRRSTSTGSGKGQGSAAAVHETPMVTSSIGSLSLLPMKTTTSPSLVSAATSATNERKRARESAERCSIRRLQGGRSPSASATTGGSTRPLQRLCRSESFGSDKSRISDTPQLRRNTTCAELDVEEVFFESVTRASPAHLQHTPTSQLLSQQQALPYSTLSEDHGVAPQGPALEQTLFTPATVARRPKPQTVLGEALRSSALSAASAPSAASPASSSASRLSSHDEAVQAILRANPPTTTRPVQLKPGYNAPSPQTPLWAALEDDRDEDDHAALGSGQALEELLLSNTQVSLFQLGDEEEANTSGAVRTTTRADALPCSRHASVITAPTVSTVGVHVPATTHECRRLGTRAAANGSISLPAPGRSLNLLDEDGLHDDERLPLFVGMESDSQDDGTDGEAFSLTQEANRQERARDMQAALPRSRAYRGAASAAAARASAAATLHAGKLGSADTFTPSPTRQRATRASHTTVQQQGSPYSQLQRVVESTMAAATVVAAGQRHTTTPVADTKPPEVLSQKELRRKTDMLRWAERTRAFFHFIDTRPLHVTSSPLKLPASTSSQARQGRCSQSVVTSHYRKRIRAVQTHKSRTPATSMSLACRSHSASTVRSVPSPSVAAHGSSSSSAFEDVISRVKREAAAAATSTRSTSAK